MYSLLYLNETVCLAPTFPHLQGAMAVRKEMFAWQVATTTAAAVEASMVEWSSVMAETGGRCVIMAGTVTTLESCADN